jgi:hypothetical protein
VNEFTSNQFVLSGLRCTTTVAANVPLIEMLKCPSSLAAVVNVFWADLSAVAMVVMMYSFKKQQSRA